MCFVADVVDISIFLYFWFFELCQVFIVEMVFDGGLVAITDLHTAQFFLPLKVSTLMKLDSNSSATMVCDLILEASLYRLGRLSSERSRRLRSMVCGLSWGRKIGSWSACDKKYMTICRIEKDRLLVGVFGYPLLGPAWVCEFRGGYRPHWVWVCAVEARSSLHALSIIIIIIP